MKVSLDKLRQVRSSGKMLAVPLVLNMSSAPPQTSNPYFDWSRGDDLRPLIGHEVWICHDEATPLEDVQAVLEEVCALRYQTYRCPDVLVWNRTKGEMWAYVTEGMPHDPMLTITFDWSDANGGY